MKKTKNSKIISNFLKNQIISENPGNNAMVFIFKIKLINETNMVWEKIRPKQDIGVKNSLGLNQIEMLNAIITLCICKSKKTW